MADPTQQVIDATNALPDPAAPGDPVTARVGGGEVVAVPIERVGPPSQASAPGSVSGASFRGITDQGIAQARKATSGTQGEIDEGVSRAAELYGTDQNALAGDTQRQLQATRESARLESDYHAKLAEYHDQIKDFYQTQATAEQQRQSHVREVGQHFLSEYEGQLAAVRQLAAISGNPLAGLTKTQGIGLGAAQFAQGFLAARGINIDVAGQVDRWVARSLAEHQQNIENARATAQDTLHLYDIARQNSNDEWEAAQRYRGFVIEQMKSSITAQAERFQSPLALSQANEKVAQLQTEADKTKFGMHQAFLGEVDRVTAQAHDWAFKRGELANQAVANNLHAQEIAVKAAKTGPILVSDPTDVQRDGNGKAISGGKNKWYIRGDVSEKIQDRAAESVDKARRGRADLSQALVDLRELRTKVNGMGGPDFVQRFRGEDYAIYEQQKALISASIKRGMEGLHGSDADQKLYERILADDSWLGGDRKELIDNLDRWSREQYQHVMDTTTGVEQLPRDGEGHSLVPRGYSEYEPVTVADPSAAANTEARFHGQARVPQETEKDYAEALQGKTESSPIVSGTYGLYTKNKAREMPGWAVSMDHLAQGSVGFVRKGPGEFADAEQHARQFEDALTEIAQRKDVPRERRDYANWLLNQAIKDPRALQEHLSDRWDGSLNKGNPNFGEVPPVDLSPYPITQYDPDRDDPGKPARLARGEL